jgi:hypothetical protein
MATQRTQKRSSLAARLGVLGLSLASLGIACAGQKDAAGLEVVVTTNMQNPADYDTVEIKVSQETAAGVFGRPLFDESASIVLPTSVSINAGSRSDQLARITVNAFKNGTSGVLVLQRIAQVDIPTTSVLELPLYLGSECKSIQCTSATQTCIGGTCQGVTITPSQLTAFNPGDVGSSGGSIGPGNGGADATVTSDDGGHGGGNGGGSGGGADGGTGFCGPCTQGMCPVMMNGSCGCVSQGGPCGNGGTCNAGACVSMGTSGGCGQAGQACCTTGGTPGCAQGTCMAQGPGGCTCAGPNQPCGATAADGLFCINGSCQPSTTTGCGPGTCGGCCDSTGTCQPGSASNACGSNGSACSSCPSSYACTGGTCQQACGQAGLACCAGNQCGGGCCDNGKCVAAGATCTTLGGTCGNGGCQNDTCGAAGQTCCQGPSGLTCTASMTTCNGTTCTHCGGPMVCCPGGVCLPGMVCNGSNACVACGAYNGPCCNPDAGTFGGGGGQSPCQTGYTCQGGICL